MYLGLWRAPCLSLRTLQQRQEQDKGSPPPGLGLPSLASWEPASRLDASCSSAQRSQATGQASAFGTAPTRQMWTLKGLQPTRIPPPTHPPPQKKARQAATALSCLLSACTGPLFALSHPRPAPREGEKHRVPERRHLSPGAKHRRL